MKRHLGIAVLCACIFPLYSNGQSYPGKIVRIVNPFAPGGNTDFVTQELNWNLINLYLQGLLS